MASLAEVCARIAAQENKSSTKSSTTQSDNSIVSLIGIWTKALLLQFVSSQR
jgi:hypothetical protein